MRRTKVTTQKTPLGDAKINGGIQVIARAASILRALGQSKGSLSLGQLARLTNLPRSTVQRIVAALAAEGFVSSGDGSGGVMIGTGIKRLAWAANDIPKELIAPHLRALGADVGETVDLAILSGGSAEFIDQVQGSQRLVALSAIGERFPLHCTANGKAILACFSQVDADALIEKSITEHPEHPASQRDALLKEINQTRESNLAFDHGEHGEGICAIGTALLDALGRPVAISIPVPEQRFAQSQDLLAEKLLDFRARIQSMISG